MLSLPDQCSDVVIMDCWFQQYFSETCVSLYGLDESVCPFFMRYFEAARPKHFPKPWIGVKKNFSPYNFNDNHWVALEIDLVDRIITFYDCLSYKPTLLYAALSPMAHLLPILLKKSLLFGDFDDSPFTVVSATGLAKNIKP